MLLFLDFIAFGNGVVLGLWLAILVGPLLFALLQATLQKGAAGGFTLAAGIWFSDLLFIVVCYFSINILLEFTRLEKFEFYTALGGSLTLFIVGMRMILSTGLAAGHPVVISKKSLLALFSKGFLINTLNPFTVFFWTGVLAISAQSDTAALHENQPGSLATGIFLTILTTDSLKVLFATRIEKWLTPRHVLLMRKAAGWVLLLFAVILLWRYW